MALASRMRRFRISGVPDGMTYSQLHEALAQQLCLEDIVLHYEELEVELPSEEADILRNVFKDAKVVWEASSYILHFQEISNTSSSSRAPASHPESRIRSSANTQAPSGGYSTYAAAPGVDAARFSSPLPAAAPVVTTETATAKPRAKRKVEKPASASGGSVSGSALAGGSAQEPESRETTEQTEESSESSRAGLADHTEKKSTEVGWFSALWR